MKGWTSRDATLMKQDMIEKQKADPVTAPKAWSLVQPMPQAP
jgi:hypothetical protein